MEIYPVYLDVLALTPRVPIRSQMDGCLYNCKLSDG